MSESHWSLLQAVRSGRTRGSVVVPIDASNIAVKLILWRICFVRTCYDEKNWHASANLEIEHRQRLANARRCVPSQIVRFASLA